MGYTVRRWMTTETSIWDDSRRAKTAEDAIAAAVRFEGIFKGAAVTDSIKEKIRTMEVGQTVRIKKKYLGLTMVIRRTKY